MLTPPIAATSLMSSYDCCGGDVRRLKLWPHDSLLLRRRRENLKLLRLLLNGGPGRSGGYRRGTPRRRTDGSTVESGAASDLRHRNNLTNCDILDGE
uniref:Uncharacterized protein n=1 Tax=Romanomermis culicivorax TaxID=13658 RepID=A0A915KG49_ROMCU